MSTTLKSTSRVAPAQLSYFAIYNPSLGATDETVRDQIVFYYSRKLEDEHEQRGKVGSSGGTTSTEPLAQEREPHHHQDESAENERLRQVGLAQGMVDFVKYVEKPIDAAGPRGVHGKLCSREHSSYAS